MSKKTQELEARIAQLELAVLRLEQPSTCPAILYPYPYPSPYRTGDPIWVWDPRTAPTYDTGTAL